MPVVVAIPNYNMADSLADLLPQVLKQEYDDVFVLDDASTDHSQEVVEAFRSNVHFVSGQENVGAGANRNRIIGALGQEAIIHFLDADMRLESERSPELARDLVANPNLAFAGGLIKTNSGQQHFWNYGPRMCAHSTLTASLQGSIEIIDAKHPEAAKKLRSRFAQTLEEWPNPFEAPEARKTFWVVESNLVIHSEKFRQIGGYDSRLRDHEIQDLALGFERVGLHREFNPLLSAVHTEVKVREGNRQAKMQAAQLQIIRKHGWKSWLLPDGHFKPTI